MIKTFILINVVIFFNSQNSNVQKIIPIEFPEYNVLVESSFKLEDTILQKYSHNEYFKFVFFDLKGKCYCERYIDGKLCEKGYFGNSLDTLKKYVSGKYIHGKASKISVFEFFQPLKNGEWIIYKNGVAKKELYIMGVLADKLVSD